VPRRFPAGRFDFLVGEEAGLGRYQMCSLFSPVLEFEDQEAARIAGRAALAALFDASLDDDAAKDAKPPASDAAPPGESAARPAAPAAEVSRRGLLMGRIAPERGRVG
jgi:[NiFe] hydrogenase assembly HybE family chaperone